MEKTASSCVTQRQHYVTRVEQNPTMSGLAGCGSLKAGLASSENVRSLTKKHQGQGEFGEIALRSDYRQVKLGPSVDYFTFVAVVSGAAPASHSVGRATGQPFVNCRPVRFDQSR